MAEHDDIAGPLPVEPHAPEPHYQAERDVVLMVCGKCKGANWVEGTTRPGETLADAVEHLLAGGQPQPRLRFQRAECLGNCDRGCSAAILSPGDWAYVFGALHAESAADLLLGARIMASVPDGPMPWRGRPQSLKTGMVARIPPLLPDGSAR